MRRIERLDTRWHFAPLYKEGMEKELPGQGGQTVCLPHNAYDIPYNYFDETKLQGRVLYRRVLALDAKSSEKPHFLDFEGVMAYARVYVNGKYAGEHKGGYTPFTIRIDKLCDFSSDKNVIAVVADSSERSDIPPFGGTIDYLTYSGMYRSVSMRVCEHTFIEHAKVECLEPLALKKSLDLQIHCQNLESHAVAAKLECCIKSYEDGETLYSQSLNITLASGANELSMRLADLDVLKLWDLDEPTLYFAELKLGTDVGDDLYQTRFGIREACFKEDGFYLNGRRLKICGLNRHQSFPYIGYAMGKRAQERDAEILKHELYLNAVRTSHYPQSPDFIRRCDEIGLLVFEEIPGWQHIGDSSWKEVALQNVREMIMRDWNFPSIILWGVRINESADDDELYARTNELAHRLDSTRQTGGVRCIKDSSLLEDVYTYNDFIHAGDNIALDQPRDVTGLQKDVPYLVTEYAGHMYPTKKYDQEERVTEHVLRHARVVDQMYGDKHIAGSFGWCAFDYNTHKDFGSGDKICYHGVMDMFRQPKFAAYLYKSQASAEIETVLEPVTYWSRGDRDLGGVLPLVILTNCDYVELKIDGQVIAEKILPASHRFPNLPHPPAILSAEDAGADAWGCWGAEWNDGVFTGYKNGKAVVTRAFTSSPVPSKMRVSVDAEKLTSSYKDTSRVRVQLLDQCGNSLWFLHEIIKLSTTGPIDIVGPREIVTSAGEAAFWVETVGTPGVATVEIESVVLGSKTVQFSVVEDL